MWYVGCVWAENCVGGVFGVCVGVCGYGDRCTVGGVVICLSTQEYAHM